MQKSFTLSNHEALKQKVLNWLRQFNTFCFLDSNEYKSTYQWIAGAGVARSFTSSGDNDLKNFQQFLSLRPSWLFGHLNYELATEDKQNFAKKKDYLKFPELFFFEPQILIYLQQDALTIIAEHPNEIFDQINTGALKNEFHHSKINIENALERDAYIEIVNALKDHIARGDCYEINFCQDFFAKHVRIDPFELFIRLNINSSNPFAAFYRINDKWLLCSSPERFLKKTGNRIISQPIKGTLRRSKKHQLQNEQQRLLNSEKDRAENVMIVDLVRNDLSRICKEDSVQVDELFGIYSFPQVHQMISTISGTLKDNIRFADIINATFPMGSMTGAPKIKVMKLIDQYEISKRGIFSGALGFIQPDGDFDFNVVIRSLMYNDTEKYLSFKAGGGITAYSDAAAEWDECMIKVKAIRDLFDT